MSLKDSPGIDGLAAAQEQDRGKYTVFVVDDSIDDRAYCLRILERSSYVYNVHCFEDGDSLMRHLSAHNFYSRPIMRHMSFLILLDMHMPGTDGLGVLQALREHPLTKHIPIVMLTHDISKEPARDAYSLQANAYLQKPLQLNDVHDVILNGRSWPARNPGGAD